MEDMMGVMGVVFGPGMNGRKEIRIRVYAFNDRIRIIVLFGSGQRTARKAATSELSRQTYPLTTFYREDHNKTSHMAQGKGCIVAQDDTRCH
jgi:hypothetical protein